MLINLLFSNLGYFIYIVLSLLIVLTIHEASHAWMANRLGDPTSRLEGRLTLNPLAHLDVFGTLFLLFVGFGWGKPVPINPLNLAKPFIDEVKIALSGPVSNLCLAIILGLIVRFIPLPAFLATFLILTIALNLTLAIFNLLPIPPLDGSKILRLILPEDLAASLDQWGMFILFGLLFLSSFGMPILPIFIYTISSFIFQIIVGTPFPL